MHRFAAGGEWAMATLHKAVTIAAPREFVWEALRDVGALHTRVVPGFVVDTRLDGATRIVTFRNGMVVREPIVSIDDRRYRIAWATEGGPATHYNAVIELVDDPAGCRVMWTTDLLPDDLAPMIDAMQDEGLATMKGTLEDAARAVRSYATESMYPPRLA
jgi:uncharacterized protein YndB with AHSA1/START domain